MTATLDSPRVRRALQFGAVSAGSIVCTQLLLAVLQVAGMAAVPANVAAVTLVAVPTFLVSRRWVWGLEGAGGAPRQALLFWVTALVGLVASTALVAALVPPGAHFAVANAVNAAAFGGAWVLKYLFLDTVVFGRRGEVHAPPRSHSALKPHRRDRRDRAA